MSHNPYPILNTEKFHPENFPRMESEMATLIKGVAHFPFMHKADIIISYLKDHCLNTQWISINPRLSAVIASNFFSTAHIEYLFDSARKHDSFLLDFEEYIKNNV